MKGIWSKGKERGFTLVELLVVIAIIGILATLVLLQLGTARARARDTQRISAVAQLRTAVETYYDDHSGQYPTLLNDTNLANYISKVPVDPLDALGYCYAFSNAPAGQGFVIWTLLEQNAAALKNDADIAPANFPSDWTSVIPGSSRCGTGTPSTGTTTDSDSCAGGAKTTCVYDQGVK